MLNGLYFNTSFTANSTAKDLSNGPVHTTTSAKQLNDRMFLFCHYLQQKSMIFTVHQKH